MHKIRIVIEGEPFGARKMAEAMVLGLRENVNHSPWELSAHVEVKGNLRMRAVTPTEFMLAAINNRQE